jgi:hypothetical protein
MHVLLQCFRRSRHDGLLTSPTRASSIARIRALLAALDAIEAATTKPEEPKAPEHPCPCCASRTRITETFLAGATAKAPPLPAKIRINTS